MQERIVHRKQKTISIIDETEKGPAFLVFSHVVIDDIRDTRAPTVSNVLGGAGSYAAVGQSFITLPNETVGLVSGIGDDFPADWFDDLAASRVDTAGLFAFDPFTPRTRIDYRDDGERTEHPLHGVDHFLRAAPSITTMPSSFSAPRGIYVFHTIAPQFWADLRVLKKMTASTVLWELNADCCVPELLPEVLQQLDAVDIVSLNTTEMGALFDVVGELNADLIERAAQTLLSAGPSAVIVRGGSDGAMVVTATGVWTSRPVPSPVVDPTGAGNAFSGAFTAAWASTGGDVSRSLRAGMAASALTIGQYGPPLPIGPAARSAFARIVDQLDDTTTSRPRTTSENRTDGIR